MIQYLLIVFALYIIRKRYLNIKSPKNLIAVVGVTGSGKSSFIKRVTGRDDIAVGETLFSSKQIWRLKV